MVADMPRSTLLVSTAALLALPAAIAGSPAFVGTPGRAGGITAARPAAACAAAPAVVGLRGSRPRARMAPSPLKMTVNGEMKPVNQKATKHDLATGRDPRRVKVFDTTLRDGEQSPGCSMTSEEKLQIAKQLHKLGVDIIEAGFPIASQDDFAAVKQIADTVGQEENPPIICGLARATPQDINTCADAVKGAKFPRIHTFIASSDIHMEHKLRKTRAEVLEITREMVTLARSHVEDVEFSAEDALRFAAAPVPISRALKPFVYGYAHIHICAQHNTTHLCICVWCACTHTFLQLCCACMFVCRSVCTCIIFLYVHVHLCVCARVCVCVYYVMYAYVYTHTHTHNI